MVAFSCLAGAGWQFFDDDGVILSGGKLYTYEAGTTTPLTTYTSSAGLSSNTNPIVLNAAGRLDNQIWITDDTDAKFVLKTSADVTVWTEDNVPTVPAGYTPNSYSFASVAALLASTDSALGEGSVWRTPAVSYAEAASNATDEDVTTAGGVKLYVQAIDGRYPAEAFGFSESNTEAENSAILRQALDKGPTSAGDGDWPLSGFLWKSYDDFQGSGYGCHFVADSGIVMKFGCLAGDSVTKGGNTVGNGDNCSPYYLINSVTVGDDTITLSSAGNATEFTNGDTAVLWSSTGYYDGYGEFKPWFQDIIGITDITAGVLTLEDAIAQNQPPNASVTGEIVGTLLTVTVADPAASLSEGHVLSGAGIGAGIYITDYGTGTGGTGTYTVSQPLAATGSIAIVATCEMYATPSAVVNGREQGTDRGIPRNVKARGFSVTTGSDSWQRFGGGYKCDIDDIWVRQSMGGCSFNGLVRSNVRLREVFFERYLHEWAMYSIDSTVTIDKWAEVPGSDNAGSILLGGTENARGCTLNVGPGYAHCTTTRYAGLQIARTADCVWNLHGTIRVADTTRLIMIDRAATDWEGFFTTNQINLDGVFGADAGNHPINANGGTAGKYHPVKIRGGRIDMPNAAVTQINSTASGLVVDCDIDAGAKPLTFNAACKDVDLRLARFAGTPSAVPSNPQVLLPDAFSTGHEIGGLAKVDTNGSAIQATSFVARWSATVPAGSFLPDDGMVFHLFGRCSGAAGAKNVVIRVTTNGATVSASAQFAAAFADDFSGRAALAFLPTAGNQRLNMTIFGNGIYPASDTAVVAHDTDTYDMLIEVGGYVANAADSLYIEAVQGDLPGRGRG